MQAEHLKQAVAEGGGIFKQFFYGNAGGIPGVLVIFTEPDGELFLSLPAQYVTPQNVRDTITRSHWFGWLVLLFRRTWRRFARKTQRQNYFQGEPNGITHNFRRIE